MTKKTYLCMQRSLGDGSTEKPSPAQMQEMYAQFSAWQDKFKAQLIDPGGKLGVGKLVTDGTRDGPFVEVKELIGGYMIVAAGSLEEAIQVARECPGLVRPGSGVEVVEIMRP
ncbi:MAG: YciI family protein [Myxococcota bacterium]